MLFNRSVDMKYLKNLLYAVSMDEESFCENYGKPDDEVYNSHYDSSAEITIHQRF